MTAGSDRFVSAFSAGASTGVTEFSDAQMSEDEHRIFSWRKSECVRALVSVAVLMCPLLLGSCVSRGTSPVVERRATEIGENSIFPKQFFGISREQLNLPGSPPSQLWLRTRQMQRDARDLSEERDLAGSERILRQALLLRLTEVKLDDPRLCGLQDNLALVLYNEKKFAEAAEIQARTLSIRCRILGPDSPDVISSIRAYVDTLFGQRDYAKIVEVVRSHILKSKLRANRDLLSGLYDQAIMNAAVKQPEFFEKWCMTNRNNLVDVFSEKVWSKVIPGYAATVIPARPLQALEVLLALLVHVQDRPEYADMIRIQLRSCVLQELKISHTRACAMCLTWARCEQTLRAPRVDLYLLGAADPTFESLIAARDFNDAFELLENVLMTGPSPQKSLVISGDSTQLTQWCESRIAALVNCSLPDFRKNVEQLARRDCSVQFLRMCLLAAYHKSLQMKDLQGYQRLLTSIAGRSSDDLNSAELLEKLADAELSTDNLELCDSLINEWTRLSKKKPALLSTKWFAMVLMGFAHREEKLNRIDQMLLRLNDALLAFERDAGSIKQFENGSLQLDNMDHLYLTLAIHLRARQNKKELDLLLGRWKEFRRDVGETPESASMRGFL